MLWHSIALLVLPALVRSHSSHHAHDQEQFSQERLNELDRKWGIDVSPTMSEIAT
jgi:agmatinase